MTEIPTLVLLDDADALTVPDLELLTFARGLGPVTVTAFARVSKDVVAQLGAYGVTRVITLDVDAPAHITGVAAHGLQSALEASGARAVLARATFANKEIAALLALRTGAGLIIDATEVSARPDGSVFGAKRVFAGAWDIECATRTPLAVLTVRANCVTPAPAEVSTTPGIEVLSVAATASAGNVRSHSRTAHAAPSSSARPDLATAAIVVAGGRGTMGDFAPVENLADALGAALGATRDCVDEGWIDHDAQIGQTGVTIAPRLYIGAGISGAPHHRGGMQASEIIVAVNSDPETPIFEICDFAVVGDLADVLPQATEAIEAYKKNRATLGV